MSTNPTFSYHGTVSHGTLREQDLVPAFLDVLDVLDSYRAARLREQFVEVLDFLDNDPDGLLLDAESDEFASTLNQQGELMERLFDALDERAPEGFYFGAHVGDGADFGFWPNEDF